MDQDRRPADLAAQKGSCLVCDGQPRVLIAMGNAPMLRYAGELLERECGCWVATVPQTGNVLARAVGQVQPDLLVVDTGRFPACCDAALERIRADRVIVIGPEPDPSYREAALRAGAGAWLARDEVADRLGAETRRVLGCSHGVDPPAHLTA